MARGDLTDVEWRIIEGLLPSERGRTSRTASVGQPESPARLIAKPTRIEIASNVCSIGSSSSVVLLPDTTRPENLSWASSPWPPQRFFNPAHDALQRRGHGVARFVTREELLAAVDTLQSLEVLGATSSFAADRELFARMPRLRTLVSPFTGVEGFDVSAATENGILVANGQIAENTVSMAEAAVLFTLASLYDLHGTERYLRENLPRPSQVRARTLMGKTVGLIGFGKIAQAIAERLSVWGVRLVASVRTTRSMPAYVTSLSLDEVLATSDVVIMAVALTPESRGMLDLDALRRMKPDVVFVNITRGGIIPDDTLATLAAERPAMRLALDVFDPEPLKEDSPLRDLPNAILTPHMVGHTVESQMRLREAFCENLLAVAEWRVPEHIVNPSVIETWLGKQYSPQL